jgi:hypothetical protein
MYQYVAHLYVAIEGGLLRDKDDQPSDQVTRPAKQKVHLDEGCKPHQHDDAPKKILVWVQIQKVIPVDLRCVAVRDIPHQVANYQSCKRAQNS